MTERRVNGTSLTEAQIDIIAERAADRALEKVYTEVGKSAVKFVLWVVGAAVLASLAWLGATGKLK